MKIVDKYIFRQTLGGFLTILFSLTILIWLTQSLRMIDMIVTKGVSVMIFLKMTFLILPYFLQILSPLALFSVALFVFIRMQADKELIVLKAVGMNSRALVKPIFLLGILLVIFSYFLTLWLIPTSYSELRQMRWKIQNDLSHLLLQEGQFSSFKNGTTLYIKERESAGKVKGILVYEIKSDKRIIHTAEEGTIIQTPEGIEIVVHNGTRQEFTPSSHEFTILKSDKNIIPFADKAGKDDRKLDPREMPLKQLLDAEPEAVNAVTYRKYKVEAFKRLTQPLYNLLFLWLAAFGVLSGYYNRRGQSKQVNIVVIAAVLIQSASLAFEYIAARNLWGLSLMGLNLFLPLLILYLVLFKERRIAWIHLVTLFSLFCFPFSAKALPKIETGELNSKAPIDFEADHMDYNFKTNALTASGNVTISQNKIHMQTEKILYYKDEDKVVAPQVVNLSLPDGTKSTVQKMTLFPKKSEAEANELVGHFTDGSRLTASKMASTEGGGIIVMENAIYTPCDICEGKAPLWQIEAKQVNQDFTDHTLTYKHMFLDVKDVPILYFPYFQMPDVTIKRKTGFLSPSFRHNSEMGFSIEAPFFVDLADTQNLLITPIISANHVPLAIIDYNARFSKGILNLQLSGTQDDNHDNEGHIKSNFEYDITSDVRLTGQLFRTISDTYFRRYDIPDVNDSDSFLQSHLTGEYFGTRAYAKAKVWHFQSLISDVSSRSIPILIPTVDAYYNSEPLFDTILSTFTHINGAIYNTRENFKSDRISLTQGISAPYTTSFGIVFQNNAYVRLDGYALNTGNEGLISKRPNDTYNKGRLYTVASSKISYPLIARTENTTQILEPIIMLILSPNSKNSEDIPNIDSTVFDFDDTNLFSENRFAGYDRVETGSRINYGLQWTAYQNGAKSRSLSFLLGQVYRLHDAQEMKDVMGYSNHLSDYVGNAQMNYEYLTLYYRFRLNRENLMKRKNDVGLTLGTEPFRIGISYLYQHSYTLDNKRYEEENEILLSASSHVTKNWQVTGYYRYDLKKDGGPIEYGSSLRYDNECTAVLFNFKKSFARDRNYKGNTSFMVKLFLKTLGGVGK